MDEEDRELDLQEIEAQLEELQEADEPELDEKPEYDEVPVAEEATTVAEKNIAVEVTMADGGDVNDEEPEAKERQSSKLGPSAEGRGVSTTTGSAAEVSDKRTSAQEKHKAQTRQGKPAASKPCVQSDTSAKRPAAPADPEVVKAILQSGIVSSTQKPAQAKRLGVKSKVASTPKISKENKQPKESTATKTRQKSAFQLFAADRKLMLKEKEPGISLLAMQKEISELWKAATAEERKQYEGQAAAENAGNKGTSGPKKGRAKSAYQLFCDAKRQGVKAANPEASFGGVTKLLAQQWKAASDDEKAPFLLQAKDCLPSQKASAGRKKGARLTKAKENVITEQKDTSGVAPLTDEDDKGSLESIAEEGDLSDREDCDWDAYPAEAVIGITANKKAIVKRKNLDLSEYGLVDARAVKRQRFEKDLQVPVTLELLEEFEEWEHKFKSAVSTNTSRGTLDLGDLGQNSPLEACYFLGKMAEKEYPLSRAEQGKDAMRKFPVLGLSMISQRLLDLERSKRIAAEKKAADLSRQLKAVLNEE